MEILSYLPMEVTDNKEAGTVVSVTPSSHTPGAFHERACGAETDERVLLTKYKSYADAHLFNT